MLDRRFFAEGTAIVVLAVLCASVSNFAAARERKLAWVGDYPRALQVPGKATASEPVATATVAPSITEATETAATPDTATTSTATLPAVSAPVATTSSSPAPVATSKPAVPQTTTAPAGLPTRPRKSFPPHPNVAALEISSEDAMQLWQEKAIFIDARRTDVFNAGRIKGARSMPVWESDIDDRVRAFFDEVTDQRQPIVIYCSGGNCEDSHMLADKLWGAGYENALVYKDGYPAWLKIGGAVE